MIKKLFSKSRPSRAFLKFEEDFKKFSAADSAKRFEMKWEERFPCLKDNTQITHFDAHYIYHPAWAARIVKQINPAIHIDISSTLHFSSILSAFVPVEFYDYRPALLNLSNMQSKPGDLMGLPFETGSVHSLSCMHTVEHVGLGRYGDPLDPEGDIKAIDELKRVCAIGGNLLFVTPVGRPRILYNAHRIYDPKMIMSYFTEFHLEEFSLVTDTNEFITGATLAQGSTQNYGCGCFWFKKKA